MNEFWDALIRGLTPVDKNEPSVWWKAPLVFLLVVIFLLIFLNFQFLLDIKSQIEDDLLLCGINMQENYTTSTHMEI